MKRKGLIPVEDVHVELIENGVPKNEQVVSSEKAFWPFFTPNICLTSWLFGIIAAQGIGFWWAVLAVVIGNVVGAIPSALCGTMGPQTRFSSLEGSRFSFGRAGVKLPAFLNWVNSIGWDAVNNIPAAAALTALIALYGLNAPFWVMLAALSLIQMGIAIYGHHFVQIIQKYMGYVLIAVFLFIGIRTSMHVDIETLTASNGFSFKAFVLALSLAAVNAAGYAPYAADYTRYIPVSTSKLSIFIKIFAGLVLGSAVMQVFGVITASLIKEPTADSLMAGLQAMAGSFAPLVLFATGVSVIPANAMNDNSGAYCLVSSGIRIARPISAAIAAIVGFVISLYGAGHLSGVVEDVILLLFYWVAPWTAIVLVHWFMTGMHEKKFERGWTSGATIFCLVTAVTVGLFSSNEIYTGPVAKALGGTDIGYYVGFFAAGLLYWLTLRFTGKKA